MTKREMVREIAAKFSFKQELVAYYMSLPYHDVLDAYEGYKEAASV